MNDIKKALELLERLTVAAEKIAKALDAMSEEGVIILNQ